ncbi:MAG: DinB family protein [Acidimicrobiales bacterium]
MAGRTGPVDDASGAPGLVVTLPAYLWFVDLALGEMVSILRRLGDDGANRRPDLAGANTPYAIVTHCLGVLEFWGGATVAARAVTRDRAAEFRAEGTVEDLVGRVATARQRFEEDISGLDALAPPTPEVLSPGDAGVPYGQTKGAVLLHVMEELFQHLGHLELTRDALRAAG